MKNRIISIMFILYIAVFAIGGIIYRDRAFSQMENRELATLPKPSAKSILSGDFSDEFETYMSDQIIFKDSLVKIKVAFNKVEGQSLINKTFFAKDNMLIRQYDKPDDQLYTNLEYMNEFAYNNPDFNITWLIAPNACYIYADMLPRYGECYNQGKVLDYIKDNISPDIRLADCSRELMEEKQDYIYYKTDHHWTMKGAYIGYKELCKALDIPATPLSDYDISMGSNEFLGTLYSNAPVFNQEPDEIWLYNNKRGKYNVEYLDTGVISDSLYNMDNLEKKDKYTVYLDGNHSILRITGNSVTSDKGKLLVVKDSYAHSLLPLLADNYSEIIVVDLRYYHNSISSLARENGIENIVFINNVDFISTDNNFLWLY